MMHGLSFLYHVINNRLKEHKQKLPEMGRHWLRDGCLLVYSPWSSPSEVTTLKSLNSADFTTTVQPEFFF